MIGSSYTRLTAEGIELTYCIGLPAYNTTLPRPMNPFGEAAWTFFNDKHR